jgi:diguanylate cyclase (GGDEF)-like protein
MMKRDLQSQIGVLTEERDRIAIENRRLGEMLEKLNNQAHVIYNISRTIAATLSLEDMIPQIVSIIRRAVSCDRATLYLVDDSGVAMTLRYIEGFNPAKTTSIRIGEGLPGRVAETGEHSHIHDLSLFYDTFRDFVHLPGEEKRDGSHIGIALRSQNDTIGVLSIDSPVKYGLTVEDMDFLALISPLLSAGIVKAALFAKIAELSRTDGLTGLFNHRVFSERLGGEVSRRERTRKPLALIMLDVDHFKQFNDTYGHPEGDAVLRELAGIINAQCRHTTIDACFRYGGEEFAVILPEEGLTQALQVAERIRKAVESHPFTIQDKVTGVRVTVSLGVAVADADEEITAEALLKRSDEALYTSKRNGRNRVSS